MGLARRRPKIHPQSAPEFCPLLVLRRAWEKGCRNRSESLMHRKDPRTNPLCLPTPSPELLTNSQGLRSCEPGKERKNPSSLEIRKYAQSYKIPYPSVGPQNDTPKLGKRNHTPPCSSAELFFAEKNGAHKGKNSVVDMVVLVFIGFLCPPPAWKVFL